MKTYDVYCRVPGYTVKTLVQVYNPVRKTYKWFAGTTSGKLYCTTSEEDKAGLEKFLTDVSATDVSITQQSVQ